MGPGAIVLLVFGVLLATGAGVAWWFGRRYGRRGAAVAGTEASSCAQADRALASWRAAASGPAPALECNGHASAPAGGVLTAPFTGQPCVWHLSTVSQHYWDLDVRGSGDSREREWKRRKRTVSEQRSDAPFQLADDTGSVSVDPQGGNVDRARPVMDEFAEQPDAPKGWHLLLGAAPGARDQTIGFQREEWLISPGERLYVLGAASNRTGSPAIGLPDTPGGELLISTRSEEQLLASTRRTQMWCFVGGGVAAVLSLACLAGAVALA